MKWLILQLLIINSLYANLGLFDLSKIHIGIEYNMGWGMGDCDLILADWENFASGTFKEVDPDLFNDDFSIQCTVYNKFIIRYTYIDLNKNINGPVGPDHSYSYGDRNSADWDFEETKYEYKNESGKQTISNIISIGYPFEIGKINKNPVWGLYKDYNIDLIVFAGLAFEESSEMDLYHWSNGFLDWYFMDEHEYYIENRVSSNSIKLSFGISLPLLFQVSAIYTGSDFRLMFGMGI